MSQHSDTPVLPPAGPLLVRVTSAVDRSAVEEGARGRTAAHFCASGHEVVAKLRAGAVAGVVLEVGPGAGRELPLVVAALEGRIVPLQLRFPLSGVAIREVLAQHARVNVLRVSVRGFDVLGADVAAILSPLLPERPRLAILAAVAPQVSGPVARIVAAAVVVGERVASVRELSALCGLSVRTLEARCHDAGILAPKPLLGWMLALHTAWRMTRWGWSAQRAAEVAGLQSADALSDRIQRATGLRLGPACRDVGFDGLLERLAAVMIVGGRKREA